MRRELAQLAGRAVPRGRLAGTALLHGDPRLLLPRQSHRLGADCVTLGSPGRAGAARRPALTFASVPRDVLVRLDGDALIVP